MKKDAKKYKMYATVSLHHDDIVDLKKRINLHYLGDEECNTLHNGTFISKYPEKETEAFKNAAYRINGSWVIELQAVFDMNGNPTFSIVDTSRHKSMNEHIPGLWNKEAIERLLRHGKKNSGSWDDTDIWDEEFPTQIMPDDEDADLIAAAPDLLEALENLIKMDEQCDQGQYIDYPDAGNVFDDARAAIAKAKARGQA